MYKEGHTKVAEAEETAAEVTQMLKEQEKKKTAEEKEAGIPFINELKKAKVNKRPRRH